MDMTHDAILEHLQGCLLPDWETLPDFGLYKDQLISFINRSLPSVSGKVDLTASMINNYVKVGLIEKPNGKKYSRTALAQLMIVIQLKLTTPMELIKTLLNPEDGKDMQALYTRFRQYQEQVLREYKSLEDPPHLMCALKSSTLQYILRLSGKEQADPAGSLPLHPGQPGNVPGAAQPPRGYEFPAQAERSGAGKMPEGLARHPKGKR